MHLDIFFNTISATMHCQQINLVCFQHNIGRGEASAEGEEQDGNEETSHCVVGLRGF